MMKMLLLPFIFIISIPTFIYSEVISGNITDLNNKPLTAIELVFQDSTDSSELSVFSNRYGDFNIELKPRSYSISLKIIEYKYPQTWKINASTDKNIDFAIDLDSFKLYERNIKAIVIERDTIISDVGDTLILGSSFDDMSLRSKAKSDAGGIIAEPMEVKTLMATKKIAASIESRSIRSDDAGGAGTGIKATNMQAGQLTSGEVNDFRKWDIWNDLTDDEFKKHSEKWEIYPDQRYTVQLINRKNTPIIDSKVYLKDKNGNIFWTGRTDNTGKAELWYNMFGEIDYQSMTKYDIEVEQDDDNIKYKNAAKFHDGVNIINTSNECSEKKNLDILFAVDATGSMSDEIKYLQAELIDIINRVRTNNEDLNVKLGSLFYRDMDDQYLLKKSPFSTEIEQTIEFINEQEAGGGGDFPEGVDIAMMSAVNEFDWSDNAVARLMFLILDAPPHDDNETIERIHELTNRMALEGIRVIPVACSGVDKSTEFILRSIALATNGTYVFLTDDSGIGNPHIEPSTDNYQVEKLNDLFIRLIEQFTITPGCNNNSLSDRELSDKIFNEGETVKGVDDIAKLIKCYPNPSDGIFTLDLLSDIDELFIVDISGKIIRKMNYTSNGKYEINISDFPSGVYYVKFSISGEWGSERIIIQK